MRDHRRHRDERIERSRNGDGKNKNFILQRLFFCFQSLREESLSVTDAVVFFDRQQNGENNLKENGINLHRSKFFPRKFDSRKFLFLFVFRVLTINRVLEILFAAGKLDLETVRNVQDFVDRNQTVLKKNKIETPTKIDVSSIREKLRSIVEKKKTNLCVSADLTSLAEIIEVKKYFLRFDLSFSLLFSFQNKSERKFRFSKFIPIFCKIFPSSKSNNSSRFRER